MKATPNAGNVTHAAEDDDPAVAAEREVRRAYVPLLNAALAYSLAVDELQAQRIRTRTLSENAAVALDVVLSQPGPLTRSIDISMTDDGVRLTLRMRKGGHTVEVEGREFDPLPMMH